MSDYQNKRTSGNLSSWILPIFLLLVFPPLGILLVVLKLLGGGGRTAVRGRHPYYAQQTGQTPVGARTTAPSARTEVPKTGKGRRRKPPQGDQIAALAAKGKKLTGIGAAVSGVFAFVLLSGLGEASYWLFNGEIRWFFQDLMDMLPILCFLGGGLGCLWAGMGKRKQAQRYRSYLAMIGRRQSITISSLASATGRSASRVREDLEDMLSEGLLPSGFLDYGGDMLVLSSDGLQEEPVPSQEPPRKEQSGQSQENAILMEIREVNDAVANEKLSAQIDRIGVITAKILEYQKSRPEKAPQLHSFLSYYLPTTLKILRAYGQLESQEVSGENITSAMERIEGMMNKVVEGFEKQLDQLFQGDAMDITTDVEVLERMLAKDGLSSNQGLTLGL